jgi:hypothetical protein
MRNNAFSSAAMTHAYGGFPLTLLQQGKAAENVRQHDEENSCICTMPGGGVAL